MATALSPSACVGGPGEVGGIGAAGVGHDDAAHGAQIGEQARLFGCKLRGIERGGRTEADQRRHRF